MDNILHLNDHYLFPTIKKGLKLYKRSADHTFSPAIFKMYDLVSGRTGADTFDINEAYKYQKIYFDFLAFRKKLFIQSLSDLMYRYLEYNTDDSDNITIYVPNSIKNLLNRLFSKINTYADFNINSDDILNIRTVLKDRDSTNLITANVSSIKLQNFLYDSRIDTYDKLCILTKLICPKTLKEYPNICRRDKVKTISFYDRLHLRNETIICAGLTNFPTLFFSKIYNDQTEPIVSDEGKEFLMISTQLLKNSFHPSALMLSNKGTIRGAIDASINYADGLV